MTPIHIIINVFFQLGFEGVFQEDVQLLVFVIVAVFNIYVCLALCPRKIPPEVQERSALGRSTTRVIEITKEG